jgi:hypothetical protein
LVTLLSLFRPARAPGDSFGYLALTFSSSTGFRRLLWLPCSHFFVQHGHQGTPLVTLLSLFRPARASVDSFGYLALTFSSSKGTRRLLWLPCSHFFVQQGHQLTPLVTLLSLFRPARASGDSFGYLSLTLLHERSMRTEFNIPFHTLTIKNALQCLWQVFHSFHIKLDTPYCFLY